MSGFLVKPDGSKRWWANFFTSASSGTPYCSAMRGERADGVHQAADGGAFLGHRDEQFAGLAVVEQADGEVAFVAGDIELVGDGRCGCRAGGGATAGRLGRAASATSCFELDDACSSSARVPRRRAASCRRRPCPWCSWCSAARNASSRRDRSRRLQAHLPAFDVGVHDVLDGAVFGHVDGLGDGAAEERLRGGHHLRCAM